MCRYSQLQREHQISPGDFPDIAKMQEQLANHDFTKFHIMDKKLLERVDRLVEYRCHDVNDDNVMISLSLAECWRRTLPS